MYRFNLKLLNLSDLKVAPARQYPVYVFIKAVDDHDSFSNLVNDNFATSITKKEKNPAQFN